MNCATRAGSFLAARSRTPLAALLAGLLLLPAADAHAGASLISGLGGPAGYGTWTELRGDDSPSLYIDVSQIFPVGLNFFYQPGEVWPRGFYININGNITFAGAVSAYTPVPFPVANRRMIAPWWGDVMTTNQSNANIDNDIYYYFDIAHQRVIVTWNQVGFYNNKISRYNSFQLILTNRSDVIAGDFDVEFRYNRCDWTTGDASGGSGGLGGTPAQAGFDAGDQQHYEALPGSRTADVLQLCNTSNVGQAGVWRYQIRTGGVAICGNGYLEQGEACDDGNTNPNDGCSADCRIETDSDGDGIVDTVDNCPFVSNPGQQNSDGDTLGNACDPCPNDPGNDNDNDGICYAVDNCPTVWNQDQADIDRNGVGDACDPNQYSYPVSRDDAYEVLQNQVLSVDAAHGVLSNDSSMYPLSASVVSNPANGSLTLNDNGSFTFTPHGGFTGQTSFTYRARDTPPNNYGNTATVRITVIPVNRAPVVEAGANKTVNEGVAVSFNGSFTDPDAGDSWTIVWNFGDGGTSSGTLTPSHTYWDSGTYTVTLTVTDAAGAVGSDTLTVTVNNVAPTVEAGPNQSVAEGQLVNLSASFSDPAQASDRNYSATVNWGDNTGTIAATVDQVQYKVTASHRYADNGSYTVTVTVADRHGASRSDTFVVTVSNVAPTVDAGADRSGNEGATITLSSASFSDPGTADTHTVTIDWGDGTGTTAGVVNEEAETISGSHVYADNGVYTVTVRISDDEGAWATDTMRVTVTNVAPTLDAGSDQVVNEGANVSLASARFSDAGAGDTHTATVDWGDGTGTVAAGVNQGAGTLSASHAYADNGVYTVTVTVKDDDGATATDTFRVTVNNVAPVAEAGPNRTAAEGELVSLGATAGFSDAGSGDTHTATVDWGDGSGPVAATVNAVTRKITASHRYADNGSYVVTVVVTDDDGASSAPDTMTVTVSNVAPQVEAGPNRSLRAVVDTLSLAPATFSDAGSGDTHTAKIDWGDGSPLTNGVVDGVAKTVSASHVYQATGTYTVTVTVTDDDNASSSDTFTVVVQNVVPIVDLVSPNGGEKVHGIQTIHFKVAQLQGKELTIEAFLGLLPVPLIEGSTVVPPNGGALLDVFRTFDSRLFADGASYELTLVASISSDLASMAQDVSQGTFWIDNTAPVITVPAAEQHPVLEQATRDGTSFTFHTMRADALDPGPSLVVSGNRNFYPLGDNTVTWTSTDWANNTSQASATVTVVDSTPPELSVGPPIVQEATSPEGTPVTLHPVATDICDAAVVVVSDAPALFPLGPTTVKFTATDASGNKTERTLLVTITDATPPQLTLPPVQQDWEQGAPAGRAADEVVLPTPEYSDNGWGTDGLTCTMTMTLVDADRQPHTLTVPCDQALPDDLYFPEGDTVVTYRVVDDSGNEHVETWTVTVADTTPPTSSVGDTSPGEGPGDWTTDPVVIDVHAEDVSDSELQIIVEPPPPGTDGHFTVDEDGNIELVYDEDGIYDVTITVIDEDGNATEIVLERFYVDLTPPVATIEDFPVVEEPDPAGHYPLFFQGELVAPVFSASDATSGLAHVVATAEPGGLHTGVVTLLERTYAPEGEPPFGPGASGDLRCTDQEGFCLGGELDLALLALGEQRLVLRATDVVGRESVLEAPFRLIDLTEALEIVQARLAGYIADAENDAPTQADLEEISEHLATGQTSLRHGYLGGTLLSMERAVKAMTDENLVAAVPALAGDAELLARGAFAQTRMYWLDVAVGTSDGQIAASYLDSSVFNRRAGFHAAAVLAAENAYFYTRNADVPFHATDMAASLTLLHQLMAEMSAYMVITELPAWELIDEVRYRLYEETLWKYEEMSDGVYVVAAYHMIHLLLDLQELATLLFDAQDQAAWVRNWQWGLSQLAREVINLAKEGIEQDIPEGAPGYCKIEEAQIQYDIGMDWLDDRLVDEMMELYASHDIRCLMLELYDFGGYRPLVPMANYQCVPTGCPEDPGGGEE